jgi:DNA polymerase III subunit delta'
MPFDSIVGQNSAREYLHRSLTRGRLAHALLFSGPEGVGKRTTALALAQALNCQASQNHKACGTCPACRKISEGVHLDVQLIIADNHYIKIEQIRESLQRGAIFQPLEGKTKVFILDPADSMTIEAANSILKILEEPPQNLVIVLITNQPFALLETIRSRCQEVRFQPVAKDELTSWLQMRLGCLENEAATLAMLSGGRPAEALRLADQDQKELRCQVLELVLQPKPRAWLAKAKVFENLHIDLQEIMAFLLGWYRDLLVLANNGDTELIINRDRLADLQATMPTQTREAWAMKYRAVLKAGEQIKKNINAQLLMENMFLQLSR